MSLATTSTVSPDPRIAAGSSDPITNPDAFAKWTIWDETNSQWVFVLTPDVLPALGLAAALDALGGLTKTF